MIDYPNLPVLAVTDGRRDRPIEVLGPEGTERMTAGVLEAFTGDL